MLKLLAKKLKGVSKEAVYVLAMQLIEGQYAVDVHPGTPVYLDPKNGTVQELLTLATEEGFNKEQLEHCLAFIKSAAPAVLEVRATAIPRGISRLTSFRRVRRMQRQCIAWWHVTPGRHCTSILNSQ